jgi:hypothetical protein
MAPSEPPSRATDAVAINQQLFVKRQTLMIVHIPSASTASQIWDSFGNLHFKLAHY